MENYATRTEAIINLQEQGYDLDFVPRNEGILCIQRNEFLKPEAFEIIGIYRFEGKRQPYDNCIIYAIESIDNDIKGILMTSFMRLENNVSIHHRSELACTLQK